MVSDRHINALVYTAADLRIWSRTIGCATGSPDNCSYHYMTAHDVHEAAYELIRTNAKSVLTRYKDNAAEYFGDMTPESCVKDLKLKRPQKDKYNLYQIYSLIAGYEYQCSEYDDYELSWAKYFCTQLRYSIILKLPEFENNNIWSV